MGELLQKQLLQLFDHLFSKDSLQRNTYFFNQMKSTLQINLLLVYKERKVQALTQDYKFILQTLKKCDKVIVNDQSRTLKIKLKPSKAKLVIMTFLLENQLQSMLQQINQNATYLIQTDQSNNFLILFNNETEATMIYNDLKSKCQCKLQEVDPYELMKLNIEKVKNEKKYIKSSYYDNQDTQNSSIQYNYQNWQNNLNNIQFQRGPGYTRKAVESEQDQPTHINNRFIQETIHHEIQITNNK